MRKYAYLKEPYAVQNDRICKIMLYQSKEGVYLFGYFHPDDIQSSYDLVYDSLKDLHEEWDERIDEKGWIKIEDPLPDCQHDAFIPLRIKGRNVGKPEWGKWETLVDGKWVDYDLSRKEAVDPEIKKITIYGENFVREFTRTRYACRAVVTEGSRILLSYEKGTDTWMIPGGGREENESDEDCCIRETAEETGYTIQLISCPVEITEYYEKARYISRYYLASCLGTCERKLTEREKEVQLEPVWLDVSEAIRIFAGHASLTEKDEMKRGLYLREYRALKQLFPAYFPKPLYSNVYYINGTAYAGKSTLVKALAEKHNGIACTENYHDDLLDELDEKEFPNLTYTRDLKDWHDFIRRSPEEYERWVRDVSKECETLELRILKDVSQTEKPVFVDTNISLETLHQISDEEHVLIMLADPEISVRRFFEREDREKQFLYRLILEEKDPEAALENFRQCLTRINSEENYQRFLHAGFAILLRDEERSIEETIKLAEEIFDLPREQSEKGSGL